MNELLTQFEAFYKLVDITYLLVFVLLSSVIIKAFKVQLKKMNWKPVYVVLIIASALAIPFCIFTSSTWVNILVSYALGTSMYELILDKIYKAIEKKLPQ